MFLDFSLLNPLGFYFAVFIHHSATWYCRLHDGDWGDASNFYNNLGQASVALFFMITAFLFFSKLLAAKDHKIDWYRLYISRILRIFPLYIFTSAVIVLIALILTDFTLQQSGIKFTLNLLKFLQFKTPDLNNVDTGLINSGVVWTLRFERSFYIALPFFAFFLRLNVSWLWFLATGVMTILVIIGDGEAISLCFVGSILAAFIVKNNFQLKFFKKLGFGLFAILCLIFEMNYFKTSFHPLALVLISVFFIAAVADNVLLKIFNSKASQFLSTISYSIYLLHGIVLFVVFKFVIRFEVAREFSVVQHWCVAGVCVAILILVSSLTYRFIELPFLNLARSKFIGFSSFSKFNK
jgi:peptidoglycan/LPS O-acetylase OafA/YrhL